MHMLLVVCQMLRSTARCWLFIFIKMNCKWIPPYFPPTLYNLTWPPNRRDHAKLLWQRIPSEVKDSSPELKDLWEIGKKLWKREFGAVYGLAQSPAWPAHLEPIVTSLIGKCIRTHRLSRKDFIKLMSPPPPPKCRASAAESHKPCLQGV